MAEAAAAARHVEAMTHSNLTLLQARCSALAAASVDKLDEDDQGDFHRWNRDILKVVTTHGADFLGALVADETVIIPRTNVTAANLLDNDNFGLPQPPEMRQLALRSVMIKHDVHFTASKWKILGKLCSRLGR